MGELIERDTANRLDSMPPIADPVIRSALASLSMREFKQEFAIKTPVDKRGIIDHKALLDQVSAFVEPGYKWKAPFFDEHHLYWQASYYDSAFNVDPKLAQDFRNLPINKIWVPREFHDFTHIMTTPGDVPEHFDMKAIVRDFRRRSYLHTITSQIVNLREVSDRAVVHTRFGKDGKQIITYIDPITRRSFDTLDDLHTRRQNFIHQVERHDRDGLIDLSTLTSLSLDEAGAVEDAIPEIRDMILPTIIRGAGRSALRVDLPYQRIAA